MMFTHSHATGVKIKSAAIEERINNSPQYKNGIFKGNIEALSMSAKEGLYTTVRFLFEDNNRTPEIPIPIQPVDLSYFSTTDSGQLNSTWLGHSSLMININGHKILTDPVFEKKVSIVGPSRFNGDVPLDIGKLPHIDVVIISHNHYDHLNQYSIKILAPITQQFIVPLGVGKKLLSWGVPGNKIFEMDWWESHHFDGSLTITATPAQHFSGRGMGDKNETLWASWVIKSKDFNIFFSGDSGYFDGFKTIGEKFGPFDMTFIECGAYDDLWKPVHMFPEETAQAHLDLKGKVLHPIHWGTFNLALHPWYDPMQRLIKAAALHDISVATPICGQSIRFGAQDMGSFWWENSLDNEKITQNP